MKKQISFFLLVFISITAVSQESLLSKNGIPILPEKGNVSIGIDAVPFLNLLKLETDNPGFNFVNNTPVIALNYLTSDKTAIRMELALNYFSDKLEETDTDDYLKYTDSSIGLGFGYEWRTGQSRVQGFYGIQGGVLAGKAKTVDDTEIVTDLLETFGIGIEGFIGAEVFIIPKLAIGGQFKWGPWYRIESDPVRETKEKFVDIGADNVNGALIMSFYF